MKDRKNIDQRSAEGLTWELNKVATTRIAELRAMTWSGFLHLRKCYHMDTSSQFMIVFQCRQEGLYLSGSMHHLLWVFKLWGLGLSY